LGVCCLLKPSPLRNAAFFFSVVGSLAWVMQAFWIWKKARWYIWKDENQIFRSRLPDVPSCSAKFHRAHQRFHNWLIFSIIFEDFPQLVLTSVYASRLGDTRSLAAVLSIAASIFAVLMKLADACNSKEHSTDSNPTGSNPTGGISTGIFIAAVLD
jgi:hypothetical protein